MVLADFVRVLIVYQQFLYDWLFFLFKNHILTYNRFGFHLLTYFFVTGCFRFRWFIQKFSFIEVGCVIHVINNPVVTCNRFKFSVNCFQAVYMDSWSYIGGIFKQNWWFICSFLFFEVVLVFWDISWTGYVGIYLFCE